jgi:hypothetical protein
MKKTIISITLLSFTFLSLHVHIHEHDHAFDVNHVSDYQKVEEDCDFCQFNSEHSLSESSTFSEKIHFKNISLEKYIVNYISYKLSCFLNKSPPQ